MFTNLFAAAAARFFSAQWAFAHFEEQGKAARLLDPQAPCGSPLTVKLAGGEADLWWEAGWVYALGEP